MSIFLSGGGGGGGWEAGRAVRGYSLIEYDETILKVQPVKYRYVLQINLLRKEEFFMFTYGTSDIAANREVCII